jgi:hypothetical protein
VRAWAWTGKPPSEEAVEAWQTCIVGLTMDDQNETGGGLGPAAMSMLMYSFSTMNVMKDFSTLAIKSMEDHSINIINGYDFKNVALTLWSYAWSGMLPCAELLQVIGPIPVVQSPDEIDACVCFQSSAQSVTRPLCFESIMLIAMFLFGLIIIVICCVAPEIDPARNCMLR